jgi:hypothetical protein
VGDGRTSPWLTTCTQTYLGETWSASHFPIHPRYEWLYIYAFAQPSTGRSFYRLMPTVSIIAFTIALHKYANFVGVNEQQHVWLLLDNASWHRSPKVQVPTGLAFRFLPAYSPELQPVEHLWQLTDVPLANRCFANLDELDQVLVEHCRWLQLQLDTVRSATCFSWWPHAT